MNKVIRLGRKVIGWAGRRLGIRFAPTMQNALNRPVKVCEAERQFYLDSGKHGGRDWSEVLIGNDRRLALRLDCFDSIRTHPIVTCEDTLLSLELRVAGGAHEGASLAVCFYPEKGGEHELLRVDINAIAGMERPVPIP